MSLRQVISQRRQQPFPFSGTNTTEKTPAIATPSRTPGEPQGLVIGVPAQWYSYGWPPQADWLRIERIYRTFPLVAAAIETLAEQAVAPGYYIEGPDADQIQAFLDNTNFRLKSLRTFREMALYGNSFWENRYSAIEKDEMDPFILTGAGDLVDFQILPPTTMRIVPDPYNGSDPAYGYVQLIYGSYLKFAPQQITHFKFNETGGQVGSDFYGMGLVQTSNDYIDAMKTMQEYLVRIMKRYAAPRGLFNYGDPAKPQPGADALNAIEAKLSKLGPDDDIVADSLLKHSDIGANVRARFEEYVDHIWFNIVVGLQNANMTLLSARVRLSDSSAKSLADTVDRKVGIMQEVFKESMEKKVLPVLIGNNNNKFVFGQVAGIDPVDNFTQLLDILKNPLVTPDTRFDVENKIRRLLQLSELPQSTEPVMPPQFAPQGEAPQSKNNGDKMTQYVGLLENFGRKLIEIQTNGDIALEGSVN